MIEIYENLFIGDQNDFDKNVVAHLGEWYVIHACKEPYHRAIVGYITLGAPKGDPEYLYAFRKHELSLNLIDGPRPEFIPVQIIDTALDTIKKQLDNGKKVLVHCNQGNSRAPSIGFMYLAKVGTYYNATFGEAEESYKKIYPAYNPASGMRGYILKAWNDLNLRS